MQNNAAIENILSRTSVRSFKDKPLEISTIDTLLRAGMAAPSAMNKQPWHLVVVSKRSTLNAIAQATPNAGPAAQAPLAIVVCGDMHKVAQDWVKDFWPQDTAALTENILLAANALDLGAVWTGIYPSEERCNLISQLLNLPSHLIPFATIVIGYPQEKPTPKDKWDTSAISYETFGGKREE